VILFFIRKTGFEEAKTSPLQVGKLEASFFYSKKQVLRKRRAPLASEKAGRFHFFTVNPKLKEGFLNALGGEAVSSLFFFENSELKRRVER